MSEKFNVSNPSGFFEFDPDQEVVYQAWLKVIQETFIKYGFAPITTPLVERENNLLGKGGNTKEMYRLQRVAEESGDTSHNGNALRFDQTVPFALYIARHQNQIQFPFKRSVIGPVFRGERPQKGRFRQFDQCDIDVVGNEKLSILHDGIIPAIIIEIFEKLLPENDFLVRINNRKFISGYLEILKIDRDKAPAIIKIIDDLEKIPRAKVLALLTEVLGVASLAETVLETFSEKKSAAEILDWGYLIQQKNPEMALFAEGFSELQAVIETLKNLNIDPARYTIDLTVMRGLDYYTGTVYETTLLGYESIGSICSGGRYADLASVFTGKKMPGVGISIGLTRLLSQIFSEKIIVPKPKSSLDVLIVPAGNESDLIQSCIKIMPRLRVKISEESLDRAFAHNLKLEVYLESKKLAKKLDYADKIGVSKVVIIGENELEAGVFEVKDMETGERLKIVL